MTTPKDNEEQHPAQKREELTEEERARLSGGVDWSAGEHAGRKALRIIDAHAADRAALVAQVAELEAEVMALQSEVDMLRDVGNGRVLVARHEFGDDSDCVKCGAYGPNEESAPCVSAAESEVTRLRTQLAAAEAKYKVAEAMFAVSDADRRREWQRADAAESEVTRLRDVQTAIVARVAELEREIERLTCIPCDADKRVAESEVARLREALAAAERNFEAADNRYQDAASHNRELTEALAAKEQGGSRWCTNCQHRAEVAEARVRELEAERREEAPRG